MAQLHEAPLRMLHADDAALLSLRRAAPPGECFAIYKAADRNKRKYATDLELAGYLFEVVTDMKQVICNDVEGLKTRMKDALNNRCAAGLPCRREVATGSSCSACIANTHSLRDCGAWGAP
jgi:hypothetical protein